MKTSDECIFLMESGGIVAVNIWSHLIYCCHHFFCCNH